MKSLFALVVLGLVGCASENSETEDSAAADTATPAPALPTNLCLMPSDHPFNGTSDVWTVRLGNVMKTKAFYWHGTPMVPENATGTTWTISSSSTTRIVAANDAGETVTVDLTLLDPRFDFYDATVSLSDAPALTGVRGEGCDMTPASTTLPGF